MMGEVELHDGRVDEARKLFEAAAAQEPSGGVLAALARIDRATGKIPSASARLQRALAAPDTARDPSLHGEILLMQSDIARDAGDANAARSLLSDALKGLAKARTGAEGQILERRIDCETLCPWWWCARDEKVLAGAVPHRPRSRRVHR